MMSPPRSRSKPARRPGTLRPPASVEGHMPSVFLVTRTWDSAWEHSKSLEEQAEWRAHADFMNGLARDGFVALGGPIAGTSDTLLVVHARDEAEIQERLSRDPWTRMRLLRVTQIRPWTVRLGSIPARAAGGGATS